MGFADGWWVTKYFQKEWVVHSDFFYKTPMDSLWFTASYCSQYLNMANEILAKTFFVCDLFRDKLIERMSASIREEST